MTEEGATKSRPVSEGTLVVVCSGTKEAVGLPGILAIDACIHDGIIGLVDIDPSCRAEWLYYLFFQFQTFMNAAATHGGTFVNLTTDIVKGIELALPPLEFQDEFIAKMRVLESSISEALNQFNLDKTVFQQLRETLLFHPLEVQTLA